MRFVHYYSGIAIALFMVLHLLNHLLILHSESMHLRFMTWARKIYRQRVVETMLLVAVVVQIMTGLYLVVGKWNRMTDPLEHVQIISGLYLAFFLLIHVRAVMLGRYKLKMDTNLYYGAGVMNMWPQKLFYIPYYSLAIISFFSHVAALHKMKMEKLVSPGVAKSQGLAILTVGIAFTIAVIYKMSHLTAAKAARKAKLKSPSFRPRKQTQSQLPIER